MEEKKRLPDAELAVMQAVWAQSGEVGRADIEGALTSHAGAPTRSTPTSRVFAKRVFSRAAAKGGTICTRRSSQETNTSSLKAAAF